MTDDTDDADTVTEQFEQPMPDATFQAVQNLIALVVDARASKQKLRALHDSLAAVTAAQAKLAADRAVFDEYERTTRAELEREQAMLRKRQLDVAATEGRFEETRKLIAAGVAERNSRDRLFDDFVPMQGSGISRDMPRPERSEAPAVRRAVRGRSIAREQFGTSTLTRDEPGPEVA